jgi:hypothetical protein
MAGVLIGLICVGIENLAFHNNGPMIGLTITVGGILYLPKDNGGHASTDGSSR